MHRILVSLTQFHHQFNMQRTNNMIPPIFPLIGQAPPANTVVGILDSNGLPGATIPLKEQGPNPQFWSERLEYVGEFTLTKDMGAGTVLTSFNAGRVQRLTDVTIDPITMPRKLMLNSSTFISFDSKDFIFWFIKPPAVKGKIRVEYFPGYVIDSEGLINTVTLDTDTLLRHNLWEFDLAASDVHTVPIVGNNPLGYYPTVLNDNIEISGTSTLAGRDGQSWFNVNLGVLRVTVQNPYTPGSIFPEACTVVLFTKFTNLKTFVLNGFRTSNSLTIQ